MVAEARHCQNPACGVVLVMPPGYVHWPEGRGIYCSRQCNGSAQPARNKERAQRMLEERAYAVEEVAFLIGTDSPSSLARRLGYEVTEQLANACRAEGRDDLANRLMREDWPGWAGVRELGDHLTHDGHDREA